ncbi:MAG: 23S rRNA (adenine(2503)-C(2))-methyltransferase RlmN, partial [Acidobacteria bacterium]|nr:23S rRNA (adenine(2503)-C(2))-methyltransferase RlmN [Acidobacteriota bacterium]
MQKKELIGLSALELKDLLVSWGEPAYRGRQLYRALYGQRQWDFRQLTPFPLALRERLEGECQATLPQVEHKFQSQDGTA